MKIMQHNKEYLSIISNRTIFITNQISFLCGQVLSDSETAAQPVTDRVPMPGADDINSMFDSLLSDTSLQNHSYRVSSLEASIIQTPSLHSSIIISID